MSAVDSALIARLEAVAPVRRSEPLARHTTFGIGGPADAFVTVRNARELMEVVTLVREAGVPHFVLGSGSNILIGDGGIRGVVVDNQAKSIEGPRAVGGEHVVRAESGASFAALARTLAKRGYAGLEWASGIPGTLGGAVVYNAGAYGGCLADVLRSITIANGSSEAKDVPADDLGLVYRGSVFTRGQFAGGVVLCTEFTVSPGDGSTLIRRVAEFDEKRLTAQPRGRNAGSMFKNTPDHPAWWLIDKVGLRGHRIGDAQISEKHCNFFMNLGEARAAEVRALMLEAERRVRESFGIELQHEVELIGEGF